ncbi:hypothetical protein LC605_19180 [Nostoc sp. CHAB 5836]|uniref:hypothetical protein n=1 Tax=Nostoc sp. CHAB 5836 TaxID=2780404 RepID=UPI001E360EFB|nr:hypothetical protein [Nostoc sp. CHAB 5836]MCC5617165.1 hypothetical protein [Nostoc sp. CHAB 5836]
MLGWVEEGNPTFSFSLLGFAYAQPNLHIFIFSLNRTVLGGDRTPILRRFLIFVGWVEQCVTQQTPPFGWVSFLNLTYTFFIFLPKPAQYWIAPYRIANSTAYRTRLNEKIKSVQMSRLD